MQAPFDLPTGEREPLPRSVSAERCLLAFIMAMLCIITMANVLVRYFTDVSFAFTEEVSVWLMVVMTLLGASTAFYRNRHIAIDFFAERSSLTVRARLAIFTRLACMAMFALLVWYGGRMAWDDYRYEVTSPALGAPQWLYSASLPVLSLLILARLARGLRGRDGPR